MRTLTMIMDDVNARNGIPVVLAVALIVRLVFVVLTPLETGQDGVIPGFNDERSHYNYVRFLAERTSLPVQSQSVRDEGAFEKSEFEYYQPPLYYLISVPFYTVGQLFGERDYMFMRLLPVVFGIIALYLAYRMMRLIFHDDGRKARTGAVLLALLGAHVRFSSLLSNDSLLWVIAGAYILLLFRIQQDRRSLRNDVLLTLLIGVGMLTKSSFLLLLPALFVPYLLRERFTMKGLVRPSVILAAGLLMASPWYYRNVAVYGSILPLTVGHGAPEGLGFSALKAATFVIYQNSFSLWFPYIVWPYPVMVKLTAAGYTLLTAVFAGTLLVHAVKHWQRYCRKPEVLIAAAVLVPFTAGYVRYSFVYGQVDARLLLPVQPFVAAALAWSLYRLAGSGERRVLTAGAAVSMIPYAVSYIWW